MQLVEGEIEKHPEWKQLLGDSGHFMFDYGKILKNGLFIGRLYTHNKDHSVAFDGLVFGRVTVDPQVTFLPPLGIPFGTVYKSSVNSP